MERSGIRGEVIPMPDAPPIPYVPAPPPLTQPQIVGKKKRRVVMIAIITLVVVLMLIAVTALWLLRYSVPSVSLAEPSPTALPDAGNRESLRSPIPAVPAGAITALPPELRVPSDQDNLYVSVAYQRSPQFSLKIAEVGRTIEDGTLADHRPVAGAPYSILRVKDSQGTTMFETPFATTTQVEIIGNRTAPDGTSLYALPTSVAYLVAPLDVGERPASVEIISKTGTVFDSQSFSFETLPRHSAASVHSRGTRMKNLVAAWLRSYLVPSAGAHAYAIRGNCDDRYIEVYCAHHGYAPPPSPSDGPSAPAGTPAGQPAPPDSPIASPSPAPDASPPLPPPAGTFVIVVVAQGQQLSEQVTKAVRTMVNSIEPWSSYAGQINVVPIVIPDEVDLQCYVIEGPQGFYPVCPNEAAVAVATTGVAWNTIVVAWSGECDCGVVDDFSVSNIATVGALASPRVIAHELGHSVGRMVDEYYYRLGINGGPLGPNCFASENSCQEALQEVGTITVSTCLLGCRSVESWRPSSELMHDWTDETYGPLETCIMAEQLRKVIGGPERFGQCTAPGAQEEPSPPPAREGDYYGGRR